MKTLMISAMAAMMTLSINATAFDQIDAASALTVSQETNDPSVNKRRTQAAHELGEVGKEDLNANDAAPIEVYPSVPGEAVIDEGYPSKAE